MPGNEYISDQNISSLAIWLTQNIVGPSRYKNNHAITGENR